jgi:L-lactate dehydrogenase complex protein LldE
MRVGLFVPCYIDVFYPEVGIATLELLERFGCDVAYPFDQTCCGQPMTNSGCHKESAATEALFVKNFTGFDYVVSPSGSCVHHVRCNFDAVEQTDEVKAVRANTFELVEFRCVSLGGVSAQGGAAQQLQHAARAQSRARIRDQRAVLFEAARPAQ